MTVEVFVLAAAVHLVVVHMIDGRSVAINPDQIVRMSEANRTVEKEKQLAEGVHCVIFFTDKSYLSTAEKCIDIANKWTQEREP